MNRFRELLGELGSEPERQNFSFAQKTEFQSIVLALTDRNGALQNCMSLITKAKEVPKSGSIS